MARPAHGGGRIGRHDLADHHPIEQVTQGGPSASGFATRPSPDKSPSEDDEQRIAYYLRKYRDIRRRNVSSESSCKLESREGIAGIEAGD